MLFGIIRGTSRLKSGAGQSPLIQNLLVLIEMAFLGIFQMKFSCITQERKETKLPCGYTVAESSAALRKTWLGFKISYSNSDSIRATEYASIITKMRVEMEIPTTDFDPDSLNEETD